MAKKLDLPKDRNVLNVPLEEAMPDNYIPYAVEVAKERALPDVRDGLKPVHRRILYGMYKLKAFPDRPYFKSARIVGDILGKYHPHGDSSVYEAMVILAQDFSTRMPLVDGHGNWGSIDGDNAAAMRYTEAKMLPFALEMLRDIEKDTVDMVDNYSDTEKEPSVLPSRFPNLLVNGAFGIAVGLATNIPPHNLNEVIDGVVELSKKPNITTEELMEHIKGPDLPTGGVIIGKKSIESAYKTGKGRVVSRAKCHIEKLETGRLGIVISEFPYRKNKARLLRTISDMTADKRHIKFLETISDIRDESDRNGIRAVIEFKKSVDMPSAEKVLNYLYKKTELQSNISFNMVSLVNGKPETLGIKDMLYHYLEHQKEVVTRRTQNDLNVAKKRFHIVEGFIKAIDIMDEVIKEIRASKSKKDAQINLIAKFGFSEEQSQAILEMMLYRLTGLEVEVFEKEYAELKKKIEELEKILSDEKELIKVVRKEILQIKKKYGDDRRSEIIESEEQAKINVEDIAYEEPVKITFSNEGFVKRIAEKSYNRSSKNVEDIDYREGDFNTYLVDSNTKETLLMYTDKGNMYQLKVVDIPDGKWREKGNRIDSIIKSLNLQKEKIVGMISTDKFKEKKDVVFYTNRGGAQKISLDKFDKSYAKLVAIKLREGEQVVSIDVRNSSIEDRYLKCLTKLGVELEFKEDRLQDNERNMVSPSIVDIPLNDELISITVSDEGDDEIKTFIVSVLKNKSLKLTSGRNPELKALCDTSKILGLFTESGKIYNIPCLYIQNAEGEMELEKLVADFDKQDKIVKAIAIDKGRDQEKQVVSVTKKATIKRFDLKELLTNPFETATTGMKENEKIATINIVEPTQDEDIVIVNSDCTYLRMPIEDVGTTRKEAKGVIGAKIKKDAQVEKTFVYKDNMKLDITEELGTKYSVDMSNLEKKSRAMAAQKFDYAVKTSVLKNVGLSKK